MPVDSPETMVAGGLEDITHDRRRSSVIAPKKGMQIAMIEENILAADERYPTADELSGPGKLRRVGAPIPWGVYTVAFVGKFTISLLSLWMLTVFRTLRTFLVLRYTSSVFQLCLPTTASDRWTSRL